MIKLGLALWCAWILWAETPKMIPWYRLDGFKTWDACRERQSWYEGKTEFRRVAMRCFPDTVDPRMLVPDDPVERVEQAARRFRESESGGRPNRGPSQGLLIR